MIVAKRYELHELVGKGGYGMVFRATDREGGRPVAVKMLSTAAKQDPQVVERLLREQQAMKALAGTHAVGAVDLCRADSGALCLVMEWLDGVDLEQHLTQLEDGGELMETSRLLKLLSPVMETLEKAHELGIVHRDIKPANIFLLHHDGGVRLLDFGLSRLKSSATLTSVGMVMGSPSYMAPEAWSGRSKAIGKEADLYSLGVIVFRALTGKIPFDADNLPEKMRRVTTAKRPSLRAFRPDLPLVADAWVERALAIDPRRRFQYAGAFLEALVAALNGLPLPPTALPTSVPPPKITETERQNAVQSALTRAGSLLKRLANSLSRAPSSPPTGSSSSHPPSSHPRVADVELPPMPPLPAPGVGRAALAPQPDPVEREDPLISDLLGNVDEEPDRKTMWLDEDDAEPIEDDVDEEAGRKTMWLDEDDLEELKEGPASEREAVLEPPAAASSEPPTPSFRPEAPATTAASSTKKPRAVAKRVSERPKAKSRAKKKLAKRRQPATRRKKNASAGKAKRQTKKRG